MPRTYFVTCPWCEANFPAHMVRAGMLPTHQYLGKVCPEVVRQYWQTLSEADKQHWQRVSQLTELSALELAYTNRR